MDVLELRLVVEVAHRASFAEVARDHGVDPSSISRMIASLEKSLGFRLFQRTTRRMTPTEAGEIYLGRLSAILDELDQARDDASAVSADPVGTLRMTATVAFGQQVIVPLVPKFKAAFPRVDLDLVFSDANLNLVSERIDLAVRLGAGVSGDLVVTKLMDTAYRVCASPDYLARQGRPQVPDELSRRDCLLFALPGFRERWLFRNGAGAISEVPVLGGIMVSGALALYALALEGAGPALLADWLVDDDIAHGRLVDLFPNHAVTATTFDTAAWLLYPSRSFVPRKVRAMIDFLRAELR